MLRLWTPLLLLIFLPAAAAVGQSSAVDTTHPQEQGQDETRRPSADRGQEVDVGAGTTAETTTGASGANETSEPSVDAQGGGATQQAQDQPPDPATVCDDLRDQAIRRQCIEKAER